MNNQNETFEYTYSASQQEEIKKIRSKYLPKENSKIEQIRELDKSVTKKGTMVGIIVGLIGCLIFGVGLSCTLVWGETLFVVGIVIGCFGAVLMALAYPLFKKITEKERERIGPKILALTEELGL